MMKKIIALAILLLIVGGCTPDEGQTADLPPAENTKESAVNPVEEPVADETQSPGETSVAPSDSVNLGEITPEPAQEDGDLIVQPAPGIPDPEVKMVQLASEQLAERLGVDIGEITLVEAVSRDWPDSGLGCPSPDLIYAAVITPGYQITLEAEGETYIYHTDTGDNAVLCVDGQPADE